MTSSLRILSASVSKRVLRTASAVAMGAGFLVAGGSHTQTLVANGDTRTLNMIHRHTGEEILITFKRNGRYDQDALNKLNWFLRDWRKDEPTRMDPHLFDIVWEVYRSVGAQSPINVVSAYRSSGTNAMLRRRSRAVAQHSRHITGQAMDFYIPGVSMTRVREAGMILQRGGVGFYPGSANQFVHMDTGSVRHWPKVSRDYLARLFPDGRTVHIPADGRPMQGFETALAMVRARGGTASRFYDSRQDESIAYDEGDDRSGIVRQRSSSMGLFATLFGGNRQQQAEPARPAPAAARPAQRAPAPQQQSAEAAPGIPATPAAPAATAVASAQPAARPGAPVQIAPAAPRMLIAQAPLPLRAPPAAVRLQAGEETEAAETRLAMAPLPPARPVLPGQAEPAVAAATPAVEPGRPTPLADTTAVAMAPLPPARPQAIGGSTAVAAALPPLITPGDQRGRGTEAEPAAPGFALAFASPSQPVSLPGTSLAGNQPRMTSAPVPRAHPAADQPAVAAAPAAPARLAANHRQAVATAVRPARPAPAPLVAPSAEGTRGVVFARQTTDRAIAAVAFSSPDPRQQTLIGQPAQVVAMSFTRSGQATVPTQRFAGPAVAMLRTVDFDGEPGAQRRASVERR